MQMYKRALHFNATGFVVMKLPGQTKPVYYYALVMKDKKTQLPPVPLTELSNSHIAVTLTHFIGKFRENSLNCFSRVHKPVRIEVDLSWPFINAVVFVFNSENIKVFE